MRRFSSALLLVLIPGMVLAQGYDRNRGRKAKAKGPAIQLQVDAIALGFGSFFDNEAVTFSADAMYGVVQFHGLGLPFVQAGTSTGISLEGHVGKLFTEPFDDTLVRVQGLDQVDWRLWSTTRVPISAIPITALERGAAARAFVGTDLLIAEGGPADHTGDFDARFVLGGDLGAIGPGNVVIEIYSFQRDIPIAFAIFYGF